MATRRPHAHTTFIHQNHPLPYPATTLVLSQHVFVSRCGRYWAWLIRAVFYDARDNAVWGKEVFLARTPEGRVFLQTGDDSSEEGSSSGEESSSEGSEESDEGEESGSDSSRRGRRVQGGGHDRNDPRTPTPRPPLPSARGPVARRESAPSGGYSRVPGGVYNIAPSRPMPFPSSPQPTTSSFLLLAQGFSHTSDRVAEATYIDPRSAHIDPRPHHIDPSFAAEGYRQPLQQRLRGIPHNVHSPPLHWDPLTQGPIPGYWTAAYDLDIGWVHYFQPHSDDS